MRKLKLSDFKGKRGAKAMADLMRLVERVAGDPLVTALFETAKGDDGAKTLAAFAALAPLLEDDEILDQAVSVIAKVTKADPDEVAEDGDILGEYVELFTSDAAVPRFFGSAAAATA